MKDPDWIPTWTTTEEPTASDFSGATALHDLVFPHGPALLAYVDEDGEALMRRISALHPERGWWADDDGTRSLVLSRTGEGVAMHFLTADGRRGPVEYAFVPPLVVMPASLGQGETFERTSEMRYGAPDESSSGWDEGVATLTAERLEGGSVRTTLVLEAGRSTVTRTSTRWIAPDAGVTREDRSLRVNAFGITVRRDDRTPELDR